MAQAMRQHRSRVRSVSGLRAPGSFFSVGALASRRLARRSLEAGLESARQDVASGRPLRRWGDFTKYANDEEAARADREAVEGDARAVLGDLVRVCQDIGLPTTCTRPAPHRCRVDGPCNGWPRHDDVVQADRTTVPSSSG